MATQAPTGASALKAVATDGKSMKPMDQIKLKIEGIQRQLASAIPQTMQKYLTPERLTRLFWQEARKNPTLLKCTPESVASSLMTAAQLGIEIGVQGQGWLVPYWNGKERRYDAQFIIGYKGLIGLARRSGEVLSVETHIVYEKDKFELKLGIETKVQHEPFLDGDRGAPKLTYGVARFRDGGYHFEWMADVEIMKIRGRSSSKNRQGEIVGPWVTDEDQMRRKTLIRRMANYLPMSIEFANALTLDDATNSGSRAVIAGQFVEVEEGQPDAPAALPEHAGGTPVPTDAPQFTKPGVLAEIEAATTEDALSLAEDLIGSLDAAADQDELREAAKKKRAEIERAGK